MFKKCVAFSLCLLAFSGIIVSAIFISLGHSEYIWVPPTCSILLYMSCCVCCCTAIWSNNEEGTTMQYQNNGEPITVIIQKPNLHNFTGFMKFPTFHGPTPSPDINSVITTPSAASPLMSLSSTTPVTGISTKQQLD